MGGKSSAPPAPDYAGAAQATATGNIEAARVAAKANRVNWDTPAGSLNYSQNPDDQDSWTATVNLSPEQQSLMEQQNKTSQGLADLQDGATQRVANSVNSALPDAYDPTKATNTAYDSLMARLQPSLDQQESSLDAKLANQGIALGSDAYKQALGIQGQTANDARTQAALQAINLGMSQQGQTYSQATANRNSPLNELNAIRTGSQVTNPSFGNSAQQATTQGADMLGAANSQYNAAMGATNASNASAASTTSGLLGAAGIAASMFF